MKLSKSKTLLTSLTIAALFSCLNSVEAKKDYTQMSKDEAARVLSLKKATYELYAMEVDAIAEKLKTVTQNNENYIKKIGANSNEEDLNEIADNDSILLSELNAIKDYSQSINTEHNLPTQLLKVSEGLKTLAKNQLRKI